MEDFLPFFTYVIRCLLPNTPSYFWKVVYAKRKKLLPMRSKLFPFRVDPLSEWQQNDFDRIALLEGE